MSTPPVAPDVLEQFELACEQHFRQVFGCIYVMVRSRETAEDLTQETFTKAYANLSAWRPTYKMTAWLYQIARNTVIDYLRAEKSARTQYLPDDEECLAPFFTQDGFEAYIATCVDMQHALSHLSPRSQEVIPLLLSDEPYDKIAERYGVAYHSVKAMVYRARQEMLHVMQEVG